MKKLLVITLLFAFAFSAPTYAQFGIQSSIKNKYRKEGKKHAEKGLDKAEDKGMEEADKGLDKATDAAEPAIDEAEKAEETAEEYTIIGLQKYQEFADGYEADVASKNPEDYKRYGFESAIVEYKLEGSDEGTKTLYIDMGGYKYAEYELIIKKKSEEKSTEMLIGSDMISIDYEHKTAIRMHNPAAYLLANPDRNWDETGRNTLIKLGYEIIGQETISGKECDIWKQGRQKIWVWNGLTLKSEIGKDIETATNIEIDVTIPNKFFDIPEGFELEIIDSGDMFPDLSEGSFEDDEYDMTEDEYNALLDEIEQMSYSEYKAKVLEEEPYADDEQIKQSYLILRQEARSRHD